MLQEGVGNMDGIEDMGGHSPHVTISYRGAQPSEDCFDTPHPPADRRVGACRGPHGAVLPLPPTSPMAAAHRIGWLGKPTRVVVTRKGEAI